MQGRAWQNKHVVIFNNSRLEKRTSWRTSRSDGGVSWDHSRCSREAWLGDTDHQHNSSFGNTSPVRTGPKRTELKLKQTVLDFYHGSNYYKHHIKCP